jgi:hypothetical protein
MMNKLLQDEENLPQTLSLGWDMLFNIDALFHDEFEADLGQTYERFIYLYPENIVTFNTSTSLKENPMLVFYVYNRDVENYYQLILNPIKLISFYKFKRLVNNFFKKNLIFFFNRFFYT